MKNDYGRQSAPGADSWHLEERSNEFVVKEGSIKSARFMQGRDRREAEKECGRSRQKTESSQWERKNGRAIENAPHQEGGQSGKRHAIACGKGQEWQQGTVRRMREKASLGARRERDVTEPSPSFQLWVLEERLCDGTVGAGGGNEPDPQVTQSDESHAKSPSFHQRACLVCGRDLGRRRE